MSPRQEVISLRAFEVTLTDAKAHRECGRFGYGQAPSSLRAVLNSRLGGRASTAYGVYVVRAERSNEVLYVGKAGTLSNSGIFKEQGLVGRLTNTRGGGSGEEWFRSVVGEYGPVVVEYVILDETYSPGLVEAILLQAYRNEHGRLPPKNEAL